MTQRNDHGLTGDDGGALLPPGVRSVVRIAVAALIVFAVYLIIVRGPAILLDLAQVTANLLCL